MNNDYCEKLRHQRIQARMNEYIAYRAELNNPDLSDRRRAKIEKLIEELRECANKDRHPLLKGK
jgi:hypothetical protein